MTIAELLRHLLPPVAYDPNGRYVGAVIDAEAQQIEAAIGSAAAVLMALHPETGYALDDWERVLGLPEPCTANLPLTRAQRVAAVLAKLAGVQGQRPQDYIDLAAALGYPGATVDKFHARRYGRARHGERYGGDAWNCVFRLNLPALQVSVRRHGLAAMGERYRSWGDQVLECAVNQRRPAHTVALFRYGDPSLRTLESGEERLTESGERRVLERTTWDYL